MAAVNTTKKTNYLNRVIANAVALQAFRTEYNALKELFASDGVISGIVDADCAASGSTQFLTAAIMSNYINNGMPIEAMLTNQAVATSNRLPNLLAVIPG